MRLNVKRNINPFYLPKSIRHLVLQLMFRWLVMAIVHEFTHGQQFNSESVSTI